MKKVHSLSNYLNVIVSFIALVQIDTKRHATRTSELPPAHSIPWANIKVQRTRTPFPRLTDEYRGLRFENTYSREWHEIDALIKILNATDDPDEFRISANTIQKIIQGGSFTPLNVFFAGYKCNPKVLEKMESIPA